jgi:hypothetical protein
MRLIVLAIRWDQDCHRLADCLLGQIAKELFRTLVATCHDAIDVLADDCVITELDNGSEPHTFKEGVYVSNDFLQSRSVIRPFV